MTSDQKTAPASPVASGMEVVGKAAGERAKMKSLADAALEQLQGAKSEAKPAEPEPDGTEPEAKTEGKTKNTGGKEAVKARAYLRLKGHSEAVLDKLTEDELVDMRARVLDRETQHDRLLQELAELKRGQSLPEAATKTEPTRTVPAVELDLKEMKAEYVKLHGLDDDAGDLLEKMLRSVHEPLAKQTKALMDEVSSLRDQVVAERGATNARLVSEARAELEDRFPQLQDSAVYESVFETMTLLSQGSEFASSKEGNEVLIRRLMERAIRAQGLEEQPDEDADAKSKHERRAQAARGQPKAPRAAKATIVPENEQMTALALHLLKNPGDKRGAMRAIGY